MGYEAKIIEKYLDKGMLRVDVEYSLPETGIRFIDSINTSCAQDEQWIFTQIKNKIKDLDAILALKDSIVNDTIVTSEEAEEQSTELSAREQYKLDKENYEKMINAVSQGIIDKDNVALVALRQKLKDNFSIDYIDLF